ncbi:MAG: TIGR04283 family arsenosugar biosynthesis glycosyltransferase [Acidobacteria bacterium]|nr:TIGR04283 family arsenosugar biosynthesis glycosyltransferase [Acidobacteriota bacterium]
MTNSDSQRATQQIISIVIPVLNEELQIAATLAGLETVAHGQQAELIVADGGSADRTVELASQLEGIRIVNCSRANRGWQMNEGAAAARGDILLFLHADVILPPDALSSIRQALVDASIAGGCFQIRFPAEATASLRAVAWGINLRTRLFQTATGDQAIFVRRIMFNELGGYETFPLMEDIALFNKLKKRGKVVILNEQVEISPRRWLKFGVWRTVLLMYALRFGYWLGIHPAKLKKLFIDVR